LTTKSMPKGGRVAGARSRLQSTFVIALADDFEQHGVDVIRLCRQERPEGYLKICASLMPREFVFESALVSLDDEEIDDLILKLEEREQRMLDGAREEKRMLIEGEVIEVKRKYEPE
jgi:hypothetical protein